MPFNNFEKKIMLDNILSKMDEDALNRLYMRCFNCPDGELVLRDLANRVYANTSTSVDADNADKLILHEGMRCVYLNIMTRLFNGVSGKKEDVT